MEKTIKYLENGEYHYATVKDVGDLAKLKTDSKDDLVTAINELFVTGGDAPKKPEGYDKLVDNVADAIQKQKDISGTIDDMQQNAQLTETEMAHIKQEQEKAYQEYLQAVKELNDAINKTKSDAENLANKTADLQNKIDTKFADVSQDVNNIHRQLDTEAAGLHNDLDNTKKDLESTRTDLLNNVKDNDRVKSEVTEIKDKIDRKIWTSDIDPVREQVVKNSTDVAQAKNELKTKADQSNLDLVTNSVEKLNTQVKENAEGLRVTVKRDELGGDVSRLLGDKTNLLLGTRNFGGANWSNKAHWREESGYWNGLKVYSSNEMWFGLQQAYQVIAGNTYTFSFYAKQDKENRSAYIVLTEANLGDTGVVTPYQTNTIVSTDWKRYSLVFRALSDGIIFPRVEQAVEDNRIYVAGYKLELGKNATPWEPNEADVAENIEKNESRFNVFSDQITGLVKKQEKMGDTERQLDTRITETAEGLKQTSKDLQNANGKITEFKGQLESTAKGIKTDYEKYTNEAVGQISDSSLNLIHNSAFSNQDNQFESWQNISAKATVREDSNNLHWVELTQSGQGTDNPIGVTSNYFIVKQGKVTVAVDVKLGDKANLDNQNILLLELYDESKKRVDFTDVSVSQLGLSMSVLNDHNVHRGLYRVGIDREDVKYMTVKAIIHRNGDLWLTNFSARLSSIDDGGYTPNPDDINHQILKMNTKIEEDAEHIALKANSVDVTRDIKGAVDGIQIGGTNLAAGTNQQYTMGFGIPNTTWKDGYAFETLPLATGVGEILPQDPHSFYYTPTQGTTYTQTIWLETDANVKDLSAVTITWWTYAGHDWQPAIIQKLGQNSYKIVSTYTWPGKSSNNLRLFDIGGGLGRAFDLTTGTYLKFGKLKLEEGNKSTSWSPAPEDTSAEIKSAKDAAIQVASDQINIHVNELSTQFDDKLNKRVNEVKTASEKFTSDGIEQTVKKITDVQNNVNSKIDNLQIGSRNYLRDSDKSISGWAQDLGTMPSEVLNSLAGKTITVSVDVEWSDFQHDDTHSKQNRLGFELSVGGSDGNHYWWGAWKAPVTPSGKERVSNTFTLPANVTFNVSNKGANGYASINGTGKVSHAKIEIGNKATDWAPAPEDINQSIKDATEYKTVTGTIDFNNLKTQQKIFYKDLQATNAPAGGNYWYYLDVEPGYDGRILQTAVSDRDNITWVRTFADSWSPWVKQADQRNVDDLNNQINGFKTETTASVKNLGDRVTTEVNSVTTKINGLQSGGQNLIQDSDANAEYATPWDNTTFDKHAFYYNGTRRMFVISNARKDELTSGCPEWFPVQAGKQYTLSFQGFMSENVSSYDVWLLGRQAGTTGIYTKTEILVNDERLSPSKCLKVTRTFTVPSDWENFEAYIRFDNNGSTDGKNSVFFFNEISLKEGNLDTGYSPSPADTADQIKKLNTKWDVANGQIQGKVTETQVNDILNGKGYATKSWAQSNFRMRSDSITLEVKEITDPISSEVNNVNSKLDNLRVGGTNLLRNSVGPFQPRTDHPIDNYDEYPDSVVELVNGEQYTISGQTNGMFSQEHNPGQESDKCVLWLVDDAGINQIISDENTAKGTTFTWEHPTKKYVLRVNTYHPGSTNQIRAWKIKIEKGNKATDWSPAPEDTNNAIENVSSKITQTADSITEQLKSYSKTGDMQNYVDTTVQKTADGISDKVSGVESKVDNANNKINGITSNGGGRNLLQGTGTASGDVSGGNGTFAQGAFNGYDAVKTNGAWQEHFINLYQSLGRTNAKAGDWYTISVYVKADKQIDTGSLDVYRALGNSDANANDGHLNAIEMSDKPITTQWQQYSWSFQINDISLQRQGTRVEYCYDTGDNWIYWAGWMLEKGTVAHDWSPAPEDTSAEIKSAKDTAINVANDKVNTYSKELQGQIDNSSKELQGKISSAKDEAINVASGKIENSSKELQGKIDNSSKELQGQISSAKDEAENRAKELESRLNTTKNDLQDIKAITQWHTVSGPIDLNDLKTPTRIFYRDIQDKNSAVTGWQYIVVDSSSDEVTQTVWKDNSTTQYIRQFTGAWSNWVRQTNQNDIDEAKTGLREEIKSAKDAAINVTKDNIEIKVNELKTTYEETLNTKINEVKTASEKFTSDGIEQVVTKVTEVKNDVDGVSNKVDNLQVGGRNLLHDTSDQWRTLQGDTWLQKTTASTCWTSTVDYHSGNTFTYAAKITNNSHQQAELEIWLCDTNKNLINGQTFHAPIPQGANAYDVSVTFPITAGTWYIRSWVIFTGGHAPNGDSVQVKEERLVEGNLAGAWTPNPDDVNQKIDSVKTEVTASVKNLGDRVTTQVNSITTRMSDQIANAVELIQKSDFSDGSKGSWTVQSIISATNPAPPAELGISGMKVIQSNVRDSYEDVWHSVTPGEKFNIDFWCAPSGVYDSSFGLAFYDANKELVPNNQWLGVRTDHSAQWKHYTGEITAPGNSAFARPWFQIDMPADQHNTSWLAKPHIRRQDPRVTEAIKEVNTKWDVANGQIQGKVTETQVNDILNGKGYATQSWAQTMFQMKSDSITLQAVRDNITNGIQDQVNGINNKIDTQTLDSADINNMRTQGHYFVRNLANSPISGWVYVDVTGNNNDRLKQDVYQDSGYEHKSRRWFDNSWTEWTTDVNNKNVISQINITPESLKISSNKIEIDGNTDIHGVLRVPDVKLAGRNGNVDLSGDGINITKNNGAGINIANNGIQLIANTNGQNEVEGVLTTTWSMNNNNQNGIGLILTTEQDLGKPYGGDIFTIGTMPKQGVVDPAVILDATGITGGNKGFNWFVPHTVIKDGGIVRMPGAQDDLLFTPIQLPGSRQSDCYQPSLSLIHQSNKALGNAGIAFQWNDIVPWGRIETSHAYFAPVGTTNNAGLGIGWVHWSDWDSDGYIPMIHRREGAKGLNAGLAFFGNGHVVYWSQDFRASLLVGLKATAGKLWPNLGGY